MIQQKSAKALEQVLQKIALSDNPFFSLPKPVSASRPKSTSFIVVKTDFGEKNEVLLPDQTKEALNTNSRLRHDTHNPRRVWL
jgi:hypothetical protein